MYYSGVLLDLDGTLYDYDMCHREALKYALNKCTEEHPCSVERLHKQYGISRDYVKSDQQTHNKCLYFKHMCETLNLPLRATYTLNRDYWDQFYSYMRPYPGVTEFLEWHKEMGIPIAIVTNYQTEYQLKKLDVLGLWPFITHLVTSEDVQAEKPSRKIFLEALSRLRLQPNQCIMIGDDTETDSAGAQGVGIWWIIVQYHDDNRKTMWATLLETLKSHRSALEELRDLCKYCGERPDLTQAGGGNISVKLQWPGGDDLIAVKSSGCSLSSVDVHKGYTVMTLDGQIVFGPRPSIEESMHRTMRSRLVVHLHPPSIISMSADEFRPDGVVLPYVKPGRELTSLLTGTETLVYLRNHGVVLCGSTVEEIKSHINAICGPSPHGIGELLRHYNKDLVVYSCGSAEHPLCCTTPDTVAYCGPEILYDVTESGLESYLEQHGRLPSLLAHHGTLYAAARSIQKCQDIEAVYRASLETKTRPLSAAAISEILGWEAEHYRMGT